MIKKLVCIGLMQINEQHNQIPIW